MDLNLFEHGDHPKLGGQSEVVDFLFFMYLTKSVINSIITLYGCELIRGQMKPALPIFDSLEFIDYTDLVENLPDGHILLPDYQKALEFLKCYK